MRISPLLNINFNENKARERFEARFEAAARAKEMDALEKARIEERQRESLEVSAIKRDFETRLNILV